MIRLNKAKTEYPKQDRRLHAKQAILEMPAGASLHTEIMTSGMLWVAVVPKMLSNTSKLIAQRGNPLVRVYLPWCRVCIVSILAYDMHVIVGIGRIRTKMIGRLIGSNFTVCFVVSTRYAMLPALSFVSIVVYTCQRGWVFVEWYAVCGVITGSGDSTIQRSDTALPGCMAGFAERRVAGLVETGLIKCFM
jgi:hypothetical protein